MGGGETLNIFKFDRRGDPKETLNWKLWIAVFATCMLSNGRGVDEGMIGGILSKKSFQDLLHFEQYNKAELADVKSNVSSISQLGALAGAIIAFMICDRIGRVWAFREMCGFWIFGEILFMTNGGRLGQIYAARFITGMGFGQGSVVIPTYLSEIAPKSVRGLCIIIFSASVYPGLALSQFANLGTERNLSPHSAGQWRIPASLHFMFAGICVVTTFFLRESPRYLIRKSRPAEAHTTLADLRNLPLDHPYITAELSDITTAFLSEKEAKGGDQSWRGVVREMLEPNHLYQILVGMGAQMFAFWSGSQTITLYAPDFFALLGKTSADDKLLTTALLGIVKLVAGFMCALFLVEVIGRKRALGIGIFLQAISMAYIALYLVIAGTGQDQSESTKHAATAAIVMIYVGGFGFAMGWNGMMYISSEMLPLRIRAVASSAIMVVHYLCQYGVNKASPLMLLPVSQNGLGPAGTFWFYFAVIMIGGFFAWFFIPETSGMGLEKTDNLFHLKWYHIGRFGRKAADERTLVDEGSSHQSLEGREVSDGFSEKKEALAVQKEVSSPMS